MRWFVPILAAVIGSGCSLLVHFDPESQPCDSAGACLTGYFCSDAGLCQSRGDAGDNCTATETACGDGADNDCDGAKDCADSDCGGLGCNDLNACTTGETCSGGTCGRGSAVVCNTPPPNSPCLNPNGSCEAGTGRCVYPTMADGSLCGAGQAVRCCAGTCVNLTISGPNCGGCGIACSGTQTCQPIEQSTCGVGEPANTSGRCGCAAGSACPNRQTCGTDGRCYPNAASDCAPSQQVADGGTCAPYCRY